MKFLSQKFFLKKKSLNLTLKNFRLYGIKYLGVTTDHKLTRNKRI